MGNVMTMAYPQARGDGSAKSEYSNRLSSEEIARYTEGYRRCCRVEHVVGAEATAASTATVAATPARKPSGNSSSNSSAFGVLDASDAQPTTVSGVTKKVFRTKVLGAFTMIPHSLSDRLFEVLDAAQTGELSLDDVLNGIAWLKYGTLDEHVHLLFIIYDLDNAGNVGRDTLVRFMDVIYGRKRARRGSTVAFLNRIFAGRVAVSLDEFKLIVGEKDEHGEALLIEWLNVLAERIGMNDDPKILELEQKYNPVVIRQRIADATLFSINEVSTLERQFHKMFDTKGGTSNRIPCDHFIAVLTEQSFPRRLLERVCATTVFPEIILFEEFCQFVSDFCRGTKESRCKHLLELYKDSGTGSVPLKVIKELIEDSAACDNDKIEATQISEESKQIMSDDIDTASWDAETFLKWSLEANAVQQLLHQMAFAACILFAIKPNSGYLEKRIVTWQWKRATKAFAVGQSWNLVGSIWWNQWCDYAELDRLNGTPHGSLPMPNVPKHAQIVVPPPPRDEGSKTVDHSRKLQASSSRPGPISNWSLLKRSGSRRLKDQLVFSQDFYMVPSLVYSTLVSWYSGGPDLSRSIVEPNGILQIELFPLVLRVSRVDPSNGGVIMSGEEVLLSNLSTPESLLEATCKALLLSKFIDKARLWVFDESEPQRKYRVRMDTPQDLKNVTQNSVFLLEVQDDDGSWPLSQSNDKVTSSPSSRNSSAKNVNGTPRNEDGDDDMDGDPDQVVTENGGRKRRREPRVMSEICSRGPLESLTSTRNSTYSDDSSDSNEPIRRTESEGVATLGTLKRRFSKNAFTGTGLVGLDNLGNTCYMSSALQCLSHTRLLVEYFKNEAYLKDINLRNKDGANGKLAVAFGELLRMMWTSDKKSFAPTEFKRVLSKFNSQFTGSDQHDSQELLACLLSGLSEDLNRIMAKPYIEQPDSVGRCDTIVADEWWKNHLKREVSVIVALFTGQYKSLLECSICHYESARFEPFTFLQLSLPESNYRSISITIIFCTDSVPLKYSARVKNEGTLQKVVDQVIELLERLQNESQANNFEKSGSTLRQPIEIAIARTSVLHTIDTLLSAKTPLSQIHEKDQLTIYQVDPIMDNSLNSLAISGTTNPKALNGLASNVIADGCNGNHDHDTDNDDSEVNHSDEETSSSYEINGNSKQQHDHDDEGSEKVHIRDQDALLVVGSSVYVKADKTKDFAAARVIGSSVKNGTVDVAYPSGLRRYHIPQSKVLQRQQDQAYVFLVHRRVERTMNSFTNSHITRLFGAPLVLRVSLRATTTFDLYTFVWKRLRRIFNWQDTPSFSELGLDGQEKISSEMIRTDTSSLALGRHLSLTKFGFCLRMVTSHGIGCSRCEWIDGCLGCVILPSPHERIQIAAEETIAIDWDIRTLKDEYDPIQASKMDLDISVQKNQNQDNMPLNLDHCMDMFTAKEHIHEAYCGRCKTLRPATKTMDLWRLPPVLVIQLKRFCYTQTSRRKLHHLVDFPLTGLTLEAFVAKQREPRRMMESGMIYWLFLGGKLKDELEQKDNDSDSDLDLSRPSPSRQVSISQLDAPATAAVRADDGFLYDLYAVVNHVGALGAGHYFAYVLSEKDGKWKCFNDHQCKDIDQKEVVSSTAYILFYRRRDTRNVSIEELFPPIVQPTNIAEKASKASQDQAQVEELLEQSKLATTGSACTIS